MIDVHCHFDMSKNPEQYILENEKKQITTIGMTNLPSHFLLGINHVKRYSHIRLAIGLHPLMANKHDDEFTKFRQFTKDTSYIGEVGLDFSREGLATKEIQIKSFEFVLDCISRKNKILSIHSRQAESETLEMLVAKRIDKAIFHWYSGNLRVLNNIVSAGYYFSINSTMIKSANGKKIIASLPKEIVLTETDFPYINKSNTLEIYSYLSSLWNVAECEVEKIIDDNFKSLIEKIKTDC